MKVYIILSLIFLSLVIPINNLTKKAPEPKPLLIKYYECTKNAPNDPNTFIISNLTINYSAVNTDETNEEKYKRILKKHNLNYCYEKQTTK